MILLAGQSANMTLFTLIFNLGNLHQFVVLTESSFIYCSLVLVGALARRSSAYNDADQALNCNNQQERQFVFANLQHTAIFTFLIASGRRLRQTHYRKGWLLKLAYSFNLFINSCASTCS